MTPTAVVLLGLALGQAPALDPAEVRRVAALLERPLAAKEFPDEMTLGRFLALLEAEYAADEKVAFCLDEKALGKDRDAVAAATIRHLPPLPGLSVRSVLRKGLARDRRGRPGVRLPPGRRRRHPAGVGRPRRRVRPPAAPGRPAAPPRPPPPGQAGRVRRPRPGRRGGGGRPRRAGRPGPQAVGGPRVVNGNRLVASLSPDRHREVADTIRWLERRLGTAVPVPEAERPPPRPPEVLLDADRRAILQAVLTDVLTNPELASSREFYGTAEDGTVCLADAGRFAWPASFPADLSGHRRVGAGSDPFEDRRRVLGIDLRQFNVVAKLAKQERAFDYPIVVCLFNAGGDANGAAGGGCAVYYVPRRVAGRWTVEFAGLLDP